MTAAMLALRLASLQRCTSKHALGFESWKLEGWGSQCSISLNSQLLCWRESNEAVHFYGIITIICHLLQCLLENVLNSLMRRKGYILIVNQHPLPLWHIKSIVKRVCDWELLSPLQCRLFWRGCNKWKILTKQNQGIAHSDYNIFWACQIHEAAELLQEISWKRIKFCITLWKETLLTTSEKKYPIIILAIILTGLFAFLMCTLYEELNQLFPSFIMYTYCCLMESLLY